MNGRERDGLDSLKVLCTVSAFAKALHCFQEGLSSDSDMFCLGLVVIRNICH